MLLRDFYLGGDIRLDFFLNPGQLSMLGRHSTRCTSGTRTQTVKDTHQTTKQLHEQQYDNQSNRTHGMVMPEHEQGPINAQYNDEWTEYHKEEKHAMKSIRGTYAMLPAPGVGSYRHLACLRTRVSLGNWPIVWN